MHLRKGMMGGICRIYRRTSYGVKLIAEIRDGRVRGREAAEIRRQLKQYGFPHVPIEFLVDQLLMADGSLGVAIIPDSQEE